MKSRFKNQDQLSLQIPNPSRFPDQFPHSIHIALSIDLCRKAVQMEKTNKQKAEQAIKPEAKKARPSPPVHGQRLFFEAKLYWMNQYGSKQSEEVKLLLYSGCTGPLLSRNFGHMNKLLKVSRALPIMVNIVQGKPIEDAGKEYTDEVILRNGDHQEELTWEILPLGKDVEGYLPISWLPEHNPDI